MILPIVRDSGKTLKLKLATSQTVVKGDVLVWSSGYLAVAASTTEDAYAIALENKTSTSDNPEILVHIIDNVTRFEADCDGVVSIVDRGTRCDLATKATLNPDAVTEKIFLIEEIVGTEEVSTKVRGRFSRFTAS